MKKKLVLVLSMVAVGYSSFAQNKMSQNQLRQFEILVAPNAEDRSTDLNLLKPKILNSKVFGDTLFYEDFDSTGWSIVNNNPNNLQWRRDTVYRPGQFSLTTQTISSTSASNGFMLLAADLFNTPIPGLGAVAADTYFELNNIDLTKGGILPNGLPSIWVTYQQSLRYCCSGANRLVLQVSTDNFVTFQEYDATDAIAVNVASGTVTNVINVSSAAANATNMSVRFLSEGNSHYYWMIDDFAVIEGSANDLSLINPYVEFNSNYQYNPFYSQIPYDLFTPLSFSGTITNGGWVNATNVRLEATINHLTLPSGTNGIGTVYLENSLPRTQLAFSSDNHVVNTPSFVPTVLGEFQVDLFATSSNINPTSSNVTYDHTFSTSDTIFARDNNNYSGGTGPRSYIRNGLPGGQMAGDKFGTMYIIESRSGNGGQSKIPTSITFAVSDDSSNIGVEISPKIWRYYEDSLLAPGGTIDGAFGAEVATSFIPYTILVNDTLITLPLDNGPAVINGLDNGQYVVGWEQTFTNGGKSFEVAQDASSGVFQKDVTCFINHAHAPGWGWVDANPVIRLNMGNLPLSSSVNKTLDSNSSIQVFPNPSDGNFTLKVKNKISKNYHISIRNSIGQLIFSEKKVTNKNLSTKIDLRNFPKGIYYLSTKSATEELFEKLIIR